MKDILSCFILDLEYIIYCACTNIAKTMFTYVRVCNTNSNIIHSLNTWMDEFFLAENTKISVLTSISNLENSRDYLISLKNSLS